MGLKVDQRDEKQKWNSRKYPGWSMNWNKDEIIGKKDKWNSEESHDMYVIGVSKWDEIK